MKSKAVIFIVVVGILLSPILALANEITINKTLSIGNRIFPVGFCNGGTFVARNNRCAVIDSFGTTVKICRNEIWLCWWFSVCFDFKAGFTK